jgi:O-antigen/teichoic acid export membrane protein
VTATTTPTSIKRNVASLGLLQAANYLLPLLVVPYLGRVLGAQAYGRLAFAQAIIQYFVLLSDYGFNLSATRRVAVHRSDPEQLSAIFWTTIATKMLLALVGLVALALISSCSPMVRESRALLACAYSAVVGTVLFPVWFFQGIERMSLVTFPMLAARFTIIPLTFVLVKTPAHSALMAAIQGGSVVGAGVIAQVLIYRGELVRWVRPTWKGIWTALVDGWHVFLSLAAVSLYSNTNTVLLRIAAGEKAVGYFAAANQIRIAAGGLATPISQAVYPRISALMARSKEEGFALIRKVLVIQGSGMLAVSTALLVGAPIVVRLLLGVHFGPAVQVLRWLAPLPFVVGLSNVFGIQTLIPLGMKDVLTRILVGAGVLNVMLVFVLSHGLGETGTAIGVLATEVGVTVTMGAVLLQRGVPIFMRPNRAAVEDAIASGSGDVP